MPGECGVPEKKKEESFKKETERALFKVHRRQNKGRREMCTYIDLSISVYKRINSIACLES